MNLSTYDTHDKESEKKLAASGSTDDCSETNPRSREEFAENFVKTYDGALKRIMRGERPKNDFREKLQEWLKIAEEMEEEEENED